jgi:site-specific DNA-methyltransferase (adenine-specific)
MTYSLFEILGCNSKTDIKAVSLKTAIPIKELEYYSVNHILPSKEHLQKIEKTLSIKKEFIMLKMGIMSRELIELLACGAGQVLETLSDSIKTRKDDITILEPAFKTELGALYNSDCIQLAKQLESNSVDMVFADPPFNLNKFYRSNIDDSLHVKEYIDWCLEWLDECIRILKPGGSLFIWNLPKWNAKYASYLNDRLNFRHWIANDIKASLPISGKLYPSHYSLLYYVKGEKPNTFAPDRLPMETCPKCFGDLKDYGGYKNKMNPKGINLTDIWYDISPVRHKKYKKREEANELPIKLLDRIIEMSTLEGDTIFDPFGGSGTTYIVAEIKKRKWIGTEIGPLDTIVKRFDEINIEKEHLISLRTNFNTLFPEKIKEKRKKLNLWTDETFLSDKDSNELISGKTLELFK